MMNNKAKKLLALLALVLTVCMLLVACDNPTPEPEHTHTYDTSKWATDRENHWHAASCEHTGEKIDLDEHIDEDSDEVCDVCEYDLHVHTHNTDEWATDETSHWYAATCGCEDEKLDLGEHTDADTDAICDVCAYEIHYHEYNTEEWASDSTGHWHAASCGHDEKADFAEHTDDFLGTCTTCGYNDAKSIIGVGIGLAKDAKDTIKKGVLESYSGTTTYEFRNGYLYIRTQNDFGYDEIYSAMTNAGIFSVICECSIDEFGAEHTETWRNDRATELNILGPEITLFNYDATYYGANDLLEGLHTLGFVDNKNLDYTESYEDGVFSFTFGYYTDSYGLYMTTVAFTLDETTNAALTVSVQTKLYSNHDDDYSIVKLTEADPENNIPETWGVIEGATPAMTSTITLTQFTEESENHNTPNPFDPSKCFATDFELTYQDGTPVEVIHIKKNSDLLINIVTNTPEDAAMTFFTFSTYGDRVNVPFDFDNLDPWRQSLQVYHMNESDTFFQLSTMADSGTEFNLNVSINGVVKTYLVIVD